MLYDGPRRSHLRYMPLLTKHAYGVAALALLTKLLLDATQRTKDLVELFPTFEYGATFREEVALHHILVPIVHVPVATGWLVLALLAAWSAVVWGIADRAWGLVMDIFSGKWLYELVTVSLPAWLPFLQSDPGIPDLVSEEDEDLEEIDGELQVPALDEAMQDSNSAEYRQRMVRQRQEQAMERLLRVKEQHANCTITRPEGWLVFDPDEEDLVLQSEYDAAHKEKQGEKRQAQDVLSNAPTVDASSGTESDRTSEATTEESDSMLEPLGHQTMSPMVDSQR